MMVQLLLDKLAKGRKKYNQSPYSMLVCTFLQTADMLKLDVFVVIM